MSYSIAQLAPTPYFSDYGCHVRILEEVRALKRLGHASTVFTYPSGETPAGSAVVRGPRIPWQRGAHVGSHWNKFLLDPLLLMAAVTSGLSRNFDIVHAHLHEGALIGSIIAKLKGIPLVFDFQGSLRAEMLDHGFISPNDPLEAVFEALERAINRLPVRIITSSEHSRSVLIEDFGIPPGRVIQVTDCVDATVFQPRASNEGGAGQIRAKLEIPDNTLVVGYLGLLAGYQGITDLLEAAAWVLEEFPACHFLIMGYPGENTYRALADRMGLGSRVTFTGRIPYAHAPAYLSAIDVAVSPKLSETEGNGKLLNYMACAIPTVVYQAPVARELLGQFGRFARSGDSRSLADEILILLTDANLRAELGAGLRRRACERFSWETGARKIESIYQEVLAEAG